MLQVARTMGSDNQASLILSTKMLVQLCEGVHVDHYFEHSSEGGSDSESAGVPRRCVGVPMRQIRRIAHAAP